jgi:hypothetical protein
MQALCSKVVCEIELAIAMAECSEKKLTNLFEGESNNYDDECISYNYDDECFDDEDEEFVFDPAGGNKWFEDALEMGLKENEIIQWGYKRKDDERDDEKIEDDEVDEKVEENIIIET